MAWVEEVTEITGREYHYFASHVDNLDGYVSTIAIQEGWHPAGYGFANPTMYAKDGKYYATWRHRDNCD